MVSQSIEAAKRNSKNEYIQYIKYIWNTLKAEIEYLNDNNKVLLFARRKKWVFKRSQIEYAAAAAE